MAASARHETRALLRAHLSAASSYRHLTRHCPICHQLLRLAMASAPRTEERSAGRTRDVPPPQAPAPREAADGRTDPKEPEAPEGSRAARAPEALEASAPVRDGRRIPRTGPAAAPAPSSGIPAPPARPASAASAAPPSLLPPSPVSPSPVSPSRAPAASPSSPEPAVASSSEEGSAPAPA